MNESIELWNRTQLNVNLNQLEHYLDHPCFRRDAIFTELTQSMFVKLVLLESALLEQAQQAGKRIDFLDEVGTNGRIEDITSLLGSISQSLYTFDSASISKDSHATITIIRPEFNHFYGAGMGYFANGLFFSCAHEDELAFFVGRNRIYFYRHLRRAFDQAKGYLLSILSPD